MPNRWWIAMGAAGLVCAGGVAPSPPMVAPDGQSGPPALVVLLSVDQMRADYVERFDDLFTSGLRRVLDGGTVFTDTRHDHAFTATAPGHAALVTGVHPARHGVVANDWWDRPSGRRVYAVEDTTARIVGLPDQPGRSPRTLLRSTVADWLREASPASKVFSVAIKDRVAVVMGGHRPTGAYWYEYESGRFVTSHYYRDEYPAWLTHFNDSGPVHTFVGSVWDRLLPEEAYGRSREDDFAPEAGGVGTTFPHLVTGSDDSLVTAYAELANSPFGDVVTLLLAREAVRREGLGRDSIPDLLAIGASSADLIGHRFGPYSQEVQDYYLRLDRMLGEFLEFLDAEVGTDRWRLVLTSDHGIAAMPEETTRRGTDAVRISTAHFRDALIGGLQQGLIAGEIFAQPSIQLLHPVGVVAAFPPGEVTDDQMRAFRAAAAEGTQQSEVIERVYTYDELRSGTPEAPDPFFELFLRSFHPDRAADLVLRHPRHYVYPDIIPANHGSVYDYDARVPLMVYGTGSRGVVSRPVRSVDVAPTLAFLLGVPAPDDLDGVALVEITR